MRKIILILCICLCAFAEPQCSTYGNLDENTLWNILRPNSFQMYFIVSVGSLSVIGLIITVCTWKFYRSFSIPADIMFAICLGQLVENISLLISSIYFLAHNQVTAPSGFGSACTSASIVYAIGNTSSLIYNVVFCVVLSLSIKKTLKGTLFSQPIYHTIIILAVAAVVTGLAVSGSLGTDINGICGYKIQNRQAFARSIVEFLVVGVCFFSMYMFHIKIPKNSYFKQASLFGYYYYYMAFFSIIQFLSTLGYFIGNIACRMDLQYSSTIIEVSITFGSCESILLSFVLIFVRFSHPVIKLKIKNFLHPIHEIKLQNEPVNPQQQPWLGSLLQSIKGSQIISFLTAILVSFAEHQHKILKQQFVSRFSFKKNYELKLNESITDQYVLRRISNRESLIVQQKLDGLRSLDYKVTAYAIQIFCQMLSNEKDVNIFHSFNINLNINLVKQQSYTNGGKSGQFFFGTYDHKFIIKTISQEQAELYQQRIIQFYQYFQNNPKTLIARILGLYRFCRTDIVDQPIYIILMRNISPYERKLQQRVYDIKGSEFHRSTIEQKKIQNIQKLRNHTLKDEDFKKLQRKICIQPEYSTPLRAQLKKDAEFLGKMGVMDYSILIIKRRGKPRDQGYNFIGTRLNELPCYQQKDLYYNIGIIDYLQSWTFKRKAERAFKTMITSKKVTVTSPGEYSQRLSNFIDQII